MVQVTFWLKFHVDYGQHIVLVGSMPELGSWVLSEGVNLTWSEGDMWNATVELPSTSVLEYKYVVVGSGGHAVSWQSGNNSVLAISDEDEDVEVHDNWGGNPGAKVVAGGNLPVTREKKLLSWATDLENQVIQQRQELRKLRMELVTAQEEARLARDEAKRLKQALAQAEAEKVTTSKAIRDVEAVNSVLKTQIKDTTASFRQALEAAVEILEADSKTKKSK
jgi:regulator of replication initiation timing